MHFFFGLVAASVREPWQRRTTGTTPLSVLLLAVGAVAAAIISILPPAAGSTHPIAIFCAGAAAITVMLLPGISGSLLLLVLGMYQPISGALHNRELGVITIFISGMVVGACVAIPLLRQVLARAHDHTMAVLSGLMLGSLIALWPWKAHYCSSLVSIIGPMTPQLPSASVLAICGQILCIGLGAALIIGLSRLSRLSKPEDSHLS